MVWLLYDENGNGKQNEKQVAHHHDEFRAHLIVGQLFLKNIDKRTCEHTASYNQYCMHPEPELLPKKIMFLLRNVYKMVT
jgi:hypothetical protein